MAGGEARLTVQLAEARVVRDIFHWVCVDRLSLHQVARRLRDQGTASPRGRDYWDRSTIWGMLKNPAYKGSAAYGKTRVGERRPRLRPLRNQPEQPRHAVSVYDVPQEEWIPIPVPAIVDEDLFEAVQEQLAENQQRHRRAQRGARYLLQGLVVCKPCGYAMCGRQMPRGNSYYRCIGNRSRRMAGERICQNTSVRADWLEEAVWNDVRDLLANPHRVEEEYHRRLHLNEQAQERPDERKLKAMVNQAQRQIARLIDAYGVGLIDKQEFEPRIRAARERLARLRADVQSQVQREAQVQEIRLVIGHLQAFAERVQAGLEHADRSARRDIIQALVKRVEVAREEARVIYRVNCRPFAQAPDRRPAQDCWRRQGTALGTQLVRETRGCGFAEYGGSGGLATRWRHACVGGAPACAAALPNVP